ncbi:MAG: hypothetical protein EPN45_23290 [Rhizobiaceae bacterium]|nr:MAG: hypothetical protein EPN45_23290 [Rhizobiaceae bacterium]
MHHLIRFRTVLVALAALTMMGFSTAAQADSGTISFVIYKAGFFVGGSAGEGTLRFHGKRYPISIGGISAGLVFGASKTRFHGTVTHIRRARDVAGVYGAAGGGGALGVGAQTIVLSNDKGAVLKLTGQQVGVQINVDLSGMSIAFK